jgi:hypothetical protein
VEGRIAVVVGEVEAAHGVVVRLPVERWDIYLQRRRVSFGMFCCRESLQGIVEAGGGVGNVA